MCHCFRFVAPPTVYQTWSSWRCAFRRFIRRVWSFKRSLTGLGIHCFSNLERLTRCLATVPRVEVDLANRCADCVNRAMGTCMSTHSMVLSEKRKPDRKCGPPVSAGSNKRVKSKNRESKKEAGTLSGNERRAPRRMIINGTSNVACLFTQQGRKGLNQDAMIVWEDFGLREDTVFCGVFDGHGPYGHLVAQSVRDLLPPKLEANWQTLSCAGDKGISLSGARNDFERSARRGHIKEDGSFSVEPGLFSLWKEAFSNAYMSMDKELRGRPNIDCFCSGTTAVTLLKQGGDVIIGNVGDSRAILGTKSDDGSLLAVQLTVDLKPNLPQEAERIRQCKGRVFALHDEPEVHRVWLPNENSPGLAMARAFGDFCLKNFGVIAVPEVTHHRLTQRDQFIVLATDGIWDVLSNDQVVDIIASVSARALAARAVVEVAVRAWRLKYPTSKVDDCAVVCLFMEDIRAVPSEPRSKEQGNAADPTVMHQISKESSGSKERECPAVGKPAGTCPPAVSSNVGAIQVHSVSGRIEDVISSEKMHNLRHSGSVVAMKNLTNAELSHKSPSELEYLANKAKSNKIEYHRNDRDTNEGLPADAYDSEWTALEGVTRVNSLVALPRFSPGDMRAGG